MHGLALVLGSSLVLACGGENPPPATNETPDAGPTVDGGVGPDQRATTITRTPLGQVEANDTQPETLTFEMPEQLVSAEIIAEVADESVQPGLEIDTLTSASGPLYDRKNGFRRLLVDPYGEGVVSIFLPNTPEIPFGPGEYRVSFYAPQPVRLNVSLITKKTTLPLDDGTLDVNIWFASTRLTAAAARDNKAFQAMLEQTASFLAVAGISLGDVSYFDVPEPEKWTQLSQDDVGKLSRTATTGLSNDAVNWFFVDSIVSNEPDQGTMLGHSAGVPGAAQHGLPGSGLALSLVSWPDGATQLANVAAHETGHWLGLFHTSERNGLIFDPIQDTATCNANDYDKNSDGVVTSLECTKADGTNLMFWQAGARPLQQNAITNDQRYVILRHPGVR
jgi:hypothetical protein